MVPVGASGRPVSQLDVKLLCVAAVGAAALLAALGVLASGWRVVGPTTGTCVHRDEEEQPDPPPAADFALPSEDAPREVPLSEAETAAWQRRLAAIPAVVAACGPRLDDPAIKLAMRPAGGGEAAGTAGPTPADLSPRRWEIQFAKGNTLETYARQLDFFGIELGVLMPGGKIVYAYNLSKLKADTRTGTVDAENRYYLSWRRGDLADADYALLDQAGIKAEGKVVLKFIPQAIEAALEKLDKGYAGPKAAAVEQTRFGIRSKGGGYEFYVVEQSYRPQAGRAP